MNAITHRQAIGDIARALRYVWPLRRLFAGKVGYSFIALFPTVIFPWPTKVLIDNVILGLPIEPSGYPFFFQPVIDALRGDLVQDDADAGTQVFDFLNWRFSISKDATLIIFGLAFLAGFFMNFTPCRPPIRRPLSARRRLGPGVRTSVGGHGS